MNAPPSNLGSVLLPKERGSWSLALEPVALGLLAAPSVAGLSLAAAVVAGFLARRPLKLAWTMAPDDPRRATAWRWTTILAVAAACALAVAAGRTGGRPLWPLLLAAPFGAAFLWYDLRQAMREAEAEVAGSIAFALVPAAFGTLAGWDAVASLALAALMLARSVPTVLTVRAYLRRRKGQPAGGKMAVAAAFAALVVVAALAACHFAPWIAPVLVAAMLVRTAFLVFSHGLTWSAQRIGIAEAIAGGLYAATLAVAIHAA